MAISSSKYCQKELHKGAQTHLRELTIVKVQRIALHCMHVQSCLTLCDPMDCSSPVSSVHGISQARILEWVSISYSTGSSRPRDRTDVSCISCIGRQILYQWATWEAPQRILNANDWLIGSLPHSYLPPSTSCSTIPWDSSLSRDSPKCHRVHQGKNGSPSTLGPLGWEQ